MYKLVLLALASCSIGCSPSWDIVRASGPPSALRGQTQFTVVTDYSLTTVDGHPEPVYARNLELEQQEHWASAKQLMDLGFVERAGQIAPHVRFVAAGDESANPDDPEVRVLYRRIQPGFWGFFIEQESIVIARVAFVVEGEVTDELVIEAECDPSKWNATIVDRLANIGRQFGHVAALFLKDAQAGD